MAVGDTLSMQGNAMQGGRTLEREKCINVSLGAAPHTSDFQKLTT